MLGSALPPLMPAPWLRQSAPCQVKKRGRELQLLLQRRAVVVLQQVVVAMLQLLQAQLATTGLLVASAGGMTRLKGPACQ